MLIKTDKCKFKDFLLGKTLTINRHWFKSANFLIDSLIERRNSVVYCQNTFKKQFYFLIQIFFNFEVKNISQH